MKPHIFFITLLIVIITFGLIIPNGLRAAAANNVWSIAFIQQAFPPPGESHQFDPPPSTHKNAGTLLARQALAQDDLKLAETFLAPQVAASNWLALDLHAAVRFRQGDYRTAITTWKALQRDVTLEKAARSLPGDVADDILLFAYQSLYELNPEKYAVNLANVLFNQQQASAAVDILQQSIQDYPQSKFRVHWFRYLGDFHRSQQDFDAAEAAYQQATLADPTDHRSWRNLGLMYHQNQAYQQAAASFEELIKLNPEIDFYHMLLGESYEKNGQIDQALTAFQSALKLNPENSRALNAIERLSPSE